MAPMKKRGRKSQGNEITDKHPAPKRTITMATSEEDDVIDNEEEIVDCSAGKIVRGVSRCQYLDKLVEANKRKFVLIFNDGQTEPVNHASYLADAIGYSIRNIAELKGVSKWRQVPEDNKKQCREKLLTWFDIEDLSSERVFRIIESKLQTSYKNWRNTLRGCYDALKEKEIDPRQNSPRPEVTKEKWLAVCDWLETDKFKDKSTKNKINRSKNPFDHTGGKKSFKTKFSKMATKSKIELFKETHTNKAGMFVNPEAAEAYNKMIEMGKAVAAEESSLTEAEILEKVLGRRRSNSLSATQQSSRLSEKLDETQVALHDTRTKLIDTQTELGSAQVKIKTLKKQLKEQKEKNKINEDKIDGLASEFQQIRELLLNIQAPPSNIT